MENEQMDEHVHKKGRHRKKLLYNSILQQMEFYFSDSNLSKDRWLSQQLQQDNYVELPLFLKFNKIRKLTSSLEDIQKAVSKSSLIELSEDKMKVRRKTPIQVKENADDCTIYVERLNSDATHESLTSVFSEFGTVVYVSIPKYKHNGMIKGFAFVEFETEQGAKNALEHFESIGCKMPSHVPPEELCSIVTYEGNDNQTKSVDKKKVDNVQSADISESHKTSEGENENNVSKKRKHSDTEQELHSKKKLRSESESEQDNLKGEANDSQDVSDNNMDAEEADGKKKKKQKKKHKNKINLKEIGLQILSKIEWKKMRNRYLNMQKQKMKQLKAHLYKSRFQNNYEGDKKKSYKIETKSSSNIIEADSTKMDTQESGDKPPLEFVSGVIVKMMLPEPLEELKKMKNEIKSRSSEVKYIDIPLPAGSEEIFVRFSSTEDAKKFCDTDIKAKCVVLEGDDEKKYWKKIVNDREVKFNKNLKKQRGKEKLLKKAERQLGKHIRFNDD